MVCLSIVFAQFCFSQNQWSLGLSIQPSIGGISNPALVDFGENVADIKTGNKRSYSIKGIVDYSIGKRMQMCTGVDFTNQGFAWTYDRNYFDMEAMEELDPDLVNWRQTTVTANYFSIVIPLSLKYELVSSSKVGFYLIAGTSFSYLFDGSWKTKAEFTDRVEDEHTDKNPSENNRKLMLGAIMGTGFNIHLNEKSKMFFEPNYQYNINRVKNTFPLDGNLFNFGINIGLIYDI